MLKNSLRFQCIFVSFYGCLSPSVAAFFSSSYVSNHGKHFRNISRTPFVLENPQRVSESGTDVQTARVFSVVEASILRVFPSKHLLGAVAVLAFSCGDVLHEVAAAAETHLKRPSLTKLPNIPYRNHCLNRSSWFCFTILVLHASGTCESS